MNLSTNELSLLKVIAHYEPVLLTQTEMVCVSPKSTAQKLVGKDLAVMTEVKTGRVIDYKLALTRSGRLFYRMVNP